METPTAISKIDWENVESLWKLAERVAPAAFIPQQFRGDVPSIFYWLATADELGLNWTFGLRSMYPDKEGSLAMKGVAMLALLLKSNFKVEFEFTKDPVIGSTCRITRPKEGSVPEARTFTMEDAARIKTHYNGTQWVSLAENRWYLNYPETMCQWRSLAMCGRIAAPDLLGGIYLPEELAEESRQQKAASAQPGVVPPPPDEPETDDPFFVGEKEDPPAETIQAAADTVAPVTDTKQAIPETTKASNETPAPAGTVPMAATTGPIPVLYRVMKVVGANSQGGHNLISLPDEKPQPSKSVAGLRARALANNKDGIAYVVWGDSEGEVVEVHNPPIPKAAPPAPPAEVRPADSPEPAATTAVPPPTFEELIAKVSKAIGGTDKKLINSLIGRYFRAYLAIPDTEPLTKDRTLLLPSLAALAGVIKARVGELRTNPAALGNALAGRAPKSLLDREFDLLSWPLNVRGLARKVMAAAGHTEEQFVAWLQSPVAGDQAKGTGLAIASLEPEALAIFFPLYLLVKGKSFIIIDWAIENKESVTGSLRTMVEIAKVPVAGPAEAKEAVRGRRG
jgi:hypothetical protein